MVRTLEPAEIKPYSKRLTQCHSCHEKMFIRELTCKKCGYVKAAKRLSKEQIIKQSQKPKPNTIRSILQRDEFNRPICPEVSFPLIHQDGSNPTDESLIVRKKSKRSGWGVFESLQIPGTSVYLNKNGNPIAALCAFPEDTILAAEIIRKEAVMDPDILKTIQALQLGAYTRIGTTYTGETAMLMIVDQNAVLRTVIRHVVVAMKAISSMVAILTGTGSVALGMVGIFPKPTFHIFYEIVNPHADMFTAIEWSPSSKGANKFAVNGINKEQSFKHRQSQNQLAIKRSTDAITLILGSLHGHIYLYSVIPGSGTEFLRLIQYAHWQRITGISACPVITKDSLLFATCSSDGYVKAWNDEDLKSIISVECSKKKVSQVVWDDGGKYILAVCDDPIDNCILVCFFYLVKDGVGSTLSLDNSLNFRKMRTLKHCTMIVSKPKVSYLIYITAEGLIKHIPSEKIRQTSLKREYRFEDDENCLQINSEGTLTECKTPETKETKKKKEDESLVELMTPKVSDGCISLKRGHKSSKKISTFLYLSTYSGNIFRISRDIDNQDAA